MQVHKMKVAALTWMTIEGHNASGQVLGVHIFLDHVGVFPESSMSQWQVDAEDSMWDLCQVSMSLSVYTWQHVYG